MPDVVAYGIAFFLAWLLGVSAWHKFRSPAFYRSLVGVYLGGLPVPAGLVPALAGAETALALLLVLPATRALALACAAGLLLGYALLMANKLLEGRRDLRCGCAGPAADVLLSPALVLRNLVCAGLGLAAIPLVAGPFGFVVTLVAGLSVASFLTLMYLCCEQLIGNAQRMAKGY